MCRDQRQGTDPPLGHDTGTRRTGDLLGEPDRAKVRVGSTLGVARLLDYREAWGGRGRGRIPKHCKCVGKVSFW